MSLRKKRELAQDERELVADRAGAAILQGYLQSMSRILADANIRSMLQDSRGGSPVRSVVAEQTLAALRSLNGSRKGIVILFLRDSHLISRGEPAISLSWADLSGADDSGGDLSRADLSDANVRDADLSEANLSVADLTKALMYGAELRNADLTGAAVEEERLALAASLVGATMPDGSEMTEERWEGLQGELS